MIAYDDDDDGSLLLDRVIRQSNYIYVPIYNSVSELVSLFELFHSKFLVISCLSHSSYMSGLS
jgi:hypothetical protein